ncbi:MAG: hypothetical protein IKZ08_02585 [Bacteroidales bacterium]|nr:hypothetical protein [Bacteroidales bacterium]
MDTSDIRNKYFEWLCDIVGGSVATESVSYSGLLMRLHSIDFRWQRALDADRADWGVEMRYRFAQTQGYGDDFDVRVHLGGTCTVLEMMIALAVRCEEDIMADPEYGDRTSQWFWSMIVSLGLGSMHNANLDVDHVDAVIQKFLDREYGSDGKGGLFTLRNAPFDAREVDIWYQLCWYLDEIDGVVVRPKSDPCTRTRERSKQM